MDKLSKMTTDELLALRIASVNWRLSAGDTDTFGMTLSDGSSCQAGSYMSDFSYKFKETDNITRVECVCDNGIFIVRIKFYDGEKVLVDTNPHSKVVKKTYRQFFDIAPNERLVGCIV